MTKRDHSKEVFSLRLTNEDRRKLMTVKRKLGWMDLPASAGEVLRLGLELLSDLSDNQLQELLDGGELHVKKKGGQGHETRG